MALLNHTIQGLYGGVSKQPDDIKPETHANEVINCDISPISGITKRKPSYFQFLIEGAGSSYNEYKNMLFGEINIDDVDYFTLLKDDPIDPLYIFDKENGNIYNINYTSGYEAALKSYLYSSNAKEELKYKKVNDKMFILNTTKTTQSLPDPSEDPNIHAPYVTHICISQGVPNTLYTISLDNNEVASYLTTDTTYDISTIINELYNDLITNGVNTTRFVGKYPNSIVIKKADNSGYDNIKVFDNFGNSSIYKIQGETSSIERLPIDGGLFRDIIKIKNDYSDNYGSSYFYFDSNLVSNQNQEWKEIRNIYENTVIDKKTMPVVIEKKNASTFRVNFVDWEKREVGDNLSAPMPSFVGNKISDITYFKGRLVFTSIGNVVFSKTKDNYNFFPTTATEVLETDPIDINLTSGKIKNIKHIVDFDNKLLFFSSDEQYSVDSDNKPLSLQTININTITNFDVNTLCQPKRVGTNIYFSQNNNTYSNIREYFINQDTLLTDASNISFHIPEYIPNNIYKIESNKENTKLFMIAKPNDEPINKIYVNNTLWYGNQRVQNAWSYWYFEGVNIIDFKIIDNEMFIIYSTEEEYKISSDPYVYSNLIAMCKININQDFTDEKFYLDYIIKDGVATIDGEDTLINFSPYLLPPTEENKNDWTLLNEDGIEIKNWSLENYTIRVSNVLLDTNKSYIIGKKYNMYFETSRFGIRDQNGIIENRGRLKIRNILLNYKKTGYLKLGSKSKPSSDFRYKEYFTNKLNTNLILGNYNTSDGDIKIIINADSKNLKFTIENNTYYPTNFYSLSWEGFYTKRSQTI